MKKILLSAIALMMSIAMMAVGLGDGTSQSNAIDFDWDDGHKPALCAGSWYRVSLDRLKAEANNPTLALYLTNLTDETANVTVNVEATISMYGKSETGTKTLNYSIDGKAHQLWSVSTFSFRGREFSLKQLMDFGLSEVYLQLTSNQEMALSAKVYETEDIVDDACTNAIDFEWSGVSVPAGEQWYYLNLTEVDNNKQLKFVVENNGATEATVNFDLSLDCPASAIVIDKEWTIAAGAKEEDEFGRIFLNVLKEDFVYLKLRTDQPITLRVEEVVVAVEPGKYDDFDCNAATLLTFDTDLNLTAGKHIYKVKRADLLAGRDHATEFYVTNNTATPANLTVEVALSTPVESTIDQKLVIDAHSTVVKPVKDNVLKAFDVEWVYIRFITDQDLTATVGMRETSPCATAKEFDWTTGASLNAGETQWYRMDITSLKQNKQHAELSFTNHSSEVALVSVDVAFECDGKVIPVTLPIPGNLSVPGDNWPISLVLDYQFLLRSPKNHIYLGISTDSHIELKSSVKDAIAADPTPCENAINPVHGQAYTHEAGATKWYKLSLDLLKSQSAKQSIYLANKSDKKARVTIGLVHDCQYTPGMRLTIPVPAGFEVGALTPNLLGRLVDALSRFEGTYNKVDSKDIYLEVYSDQELEFGLGVNNAITNPCLRTDLISFDWNNGVQVEANKAAWYDLDITTIKNDGKHVKLTFTNPTQSIVWVATVVSVNCPAELTVPMIVPVPAGMSVDHVIDYSVFAATYVDHLYVGVKAEDVLKLTAETIDADASASNQADCNAATLVESGKTYTHKAGAHWYHFPMSLLDNMGDAARVTFKNNGAKTAILSAGVTVDCQYGIVNRVPVKVPNGVDMSLSIPARVINKVREWIDADVADFYLHLDSDQDLAFGLDMDAVSVTACSSAVDFDWQAWEANGLQIQANQDVWYKVNLDYPLEKLQEGENIVVSLSNLANDMDVEVEIAVSPTCPALVSLEKFVTIPANEKLIKEFSYKEVMALLDRYNKYVYDSESEKLLGHYDTYVFFNKLEKLMGRYGKYVPFGQIDLLIKRYGAHLTVSGIIDMIENYEQYISIASLKKQLAAHKEYVSYDKLMGLLDQYGDYIPSSRAKQLLEQYGDYIPYLGGGAVLLLDRCEKYFTTDDLQKVVNRLKQYLPIDELKQLLKRYEKFLPEDNTCYVNVKSKGNLVVDPEPPIETPEGCDAAVELDYNKTYNLSELPNGWYKVGLDGIHAAQKNLELNLNNDLGKDTLVTVSAFKSCDDVKPMATRARKMRVGLNTESIPYVLIQQYASGIDTLYMYIETGVHLCGTLSCESAVAFPWNTTVVVDKEAWYTINVDDLLALDTLIATVRNTTDLTVSANIEVSVVCPVDEDVVAVVKDFVAGYEKKDVMTVADIQDKLDQYGAYPGDVIYMHICPVGALELTLNAVHCDTTTAEFTKTICEGDAYTWDVNGVTYSNLAVGVHEFTHHVENGCNLTINTLKLTVINDNTTMPVENIAICAGESYTWHGTAYTEAGDYTYEEVLECGTVVYSLHLEVNNCDEPCQDAEPLTVECGTTIQLEANTDKWYILDVDAITALDDNVRLVVENGSEDNTITVEYGVECPSDPWTTTKPYIISANAKKTAIITQNDLDMAGVIDYVYVHITTTGKLTATVKCCYEYETITGSVCDGDTYVDPITGKGHVISSLIAASQTWNDTVITDLACDSIYTFVITPTVAPQVMTEDLLATIPGALPTLNPGCTVDVAGTIEAIKAYYELNDTEAIADVVNVEWTAGADATLDCNATEHTMTLKVEAGCDFVINTTINLTVEPIVANEHSTNETICEGESYTWAVNGMSYTPTASMTDVYEVTNDCGCVVDRYTLTLTVNTATETTLAAIPVEICETELPYAWNVADTTILCTETKTYTHTVVDGCSKTTHVLELTVNKVEETTLAAIPVAICETELPYIWTVVEGVTVACDKADTYTYTIDGDCSKTTHVLELTVNKVEETTLAAIPVAICETELPYIWTVVEGVTVTCDKADTYTYTIDGDCSKTTHVLELTVNKVEETTLAAIPVAICETELPYIWTVVEGVTVTCDKADTYTYTVDGECSKTTHVLTLTVYATPEDVVEYDTICPGETITWNGVTFATAGEHTLTLPNENGCEYQATLHLHIPDPENFVAYDKIPAESKYGGRMMVINLNAIDSIFGWTPAEGDVQWFKVVGEVDNAFDALNRLGNPAELDELVHTGYYHTAFDGSVMPDSYYALIVHEMVSGECQEIMRTTVLSSSAAVKAPQLVPTIAEPSEQLRILNLNPSNVTEVRVFNTSGELIENYTAAEATEFVFKAATMQGYYMVEVQSENDKVTLRYIVK